MRKNKNKNSGLNSCSIRVNKPKMLKSKVRKKYKEMNQTKKQNLLKIIQSLKKQKQ